ncbi:MAG: ribosome biogenesis GTPase YlqF [Spongiibacter sp.]|nr:ribosome biogenesis GTPase YlqF [Spongiibacter sp.]
MAIQWYPGHMHKAQKDIKKILPTVDLLIEVLDARIPFSSENPAIASLRGDKPCIKVLNKADLADPEATVAWQTYLEQERGVRAIATTNNNPGEIKQILDLCKKMLPEKAASPRDIDTMIVGIPNVGKSTLINILAGRIIAKTGNEPAVTKSQQRIKIGDGIALLDTPGILWPKIENPNSAYRLAVTGAIKNTAMEFDDVGFYAAEYLIKAYPELLKVRYKLEDIPNTDLAFLEAAALSRGALGAKGRVNLHKICELLINELRSGMIGRITLESPEMVEAELLEVEAEKARKEAEKAERKRRFKAGSRNPDPDGKSTAAGQNPSAPAGKGGARRKRR